MSCFSCVLLFGCVVAGDDFVSSPNMHQAEDLLPISVAKSPSDFSVPEKAEAT